jgi:hypothetical protein
MVMCFWVAAGTRVRSEEGEWLHLEDDAYNNIIGRVPIT